VDFAPTLPAALEQLRGCDHYLLLGRSAEVVFARAEQLQFVPQSQYFRRALAERFGVPRSWDWREVNEPEAALLTTLAAFNTDVPQRPRHP
jgi:hypothetical protein